MSTLTDEMVRRLCDECGCEFDAVAGGFMLCHECLIERLGGAEALAEWEPPVDRHRRLCGELAVAGEDPLPLKQDLPEDAEPLSELEELGLYEGADRQVFIDVRKYLGIAKTYPCALCGHHGWTAGDDLGSTLLLANFEGWLAVHGDCLVTSFNMTTWEAIRDARLLKTRAELIAMSTTVD